MNDLRKAAEMAWNYFRNAEDITVEGKQIMEALRQALAQPEQECVAIVNEGMGGIEWLSPCLPDDTPLYAAPPSIEAAVLAEREACVKVCDEFGKEWNCESTTNEIIAAIRARGEK